MYIGLYIRKLIIGSQKREVQELLKKNTEREYASPCIGENTFTSSGSSLRYNFGIITRNTWKI